MVGRYETQLKQQEELIKQWQDVQGRVLIFDKQGERYYIYTYLYLLPDNTDLTGKTFNFTIIVTQSQIADKSMY